MKKMKAAPYKKVVEFHGHSCPGLALGYRVSLAALDFFHENRSEDEELVAVIENDSCAADAVQFVTGCTLGKGNLFVDNKGKHVYTFHSRFSGFGVRISEDYKKTASPDFKKLRDKIVSGKATDEDKKQFEEVKGAIVGDILKATAETFLKLERVETPPPPMARVARSVKCSKCGEKTMITRAVKIDGKHVCPDCADKSKKQK